MAEVGKRMSDRTIRMWLGSAAALLVLVLASMQVNSFNENRQLRGSVDRSYQRSLLLDRLLLLHQDVETGQRGYALTGNPEFLQPYLKARPQISAALASLRTSTADPAALPHVTALEALSAEKIAISANVIEHRRRGDDQQARELIATARGKRVMDRFRDEIAILQRGEFEKLEALLRSSAESNARSLNWTAGIEALLLLLLGAAFYAYMANLSRLARVTASARDTSRRQVAIFDAATDAMIVIDDRGCVEGINPAGLVLFGLNGDTAAGRDVRALFDLASGDRGTLLQAGEESSLSNRTAVRGDGSRFEAEVAASSVMLAGGRRTLLVVRDATERNRVERMKNEFVSTVSHELRTPLTSIRGALALLHHAVGKTLDPKSLTLLTMAKSNSERLSVLIDDILSIEKIGSGSMEFEMAPIDLAKVVHDAVEQNRAYADDVGVSLILTNWPQPLPVTGDASRLIQAFTNLISNAAKFSRKGGVVSIIAEAVDGHARVSVADQGDGIPIEFRPRLFDRFSQAQGQRSSRAGTGLGLAITKAIVDRHDGRIGYESEIGTGTLFWIELPLAESE